MRPHYLPALLSASLALAQPGGPVTPDPALRKTLLDALRQPLQTELKQPVRFVVNRLTATADWAFGELRPTQPGGQLIVYKKTPYQPLIDDGIFDEGIYALWQRKQGRWSVRTYIVGATDVPYGCWWKEYGAPRAVLPYAEADCR